jgi:hypothetical protein
MRKIILAFMTSLFIALLLSANGFANTTNGGRITDPTSLGRAVPDTGKRSDYDNGIKETNGNSMNDSNVNRSFTNLNTISSTNPDDGMNWSWLGLLGLLGLVGLTKNRGRS